MANERFDYVTLRVIPDALMGRPAYNEGEGIMAQVVEDLGLIVGEDVRPARPDSMDMPAASASRAQWAKYAEIQGVPQDEVDAATRDELRNRFIEPEPEPDAGVKASAKTTKPVKGE